MALCAGRDLDECAEQQLRRHLSSCPDCRDQWQRVQASTQVLQRAAEADPPSVELRLWSDVSAALEQIDRDQSQPADSRRTPLWIPVFAVAALVMAAVSMFQTLSPSPDEVADNDDVRIAPTAAPAVDDGRPVFGPIQGPASVEFQLDPLQGPGNE